MQKDIEKVKTFYILDQIYLKFYILNMILTAFIYNLFFELSVLVYIIEILIPKLCKKVYINFLIYQANLKLSNDLADKQIFLLLF